jgi:acetyl-CoA carboxylase biotin carboxylase subunit
MEHESFRNGTFDTNFVSRYYKPENLTSGSQTDEIFLAALLSAKILSSDSSIKMSPADFQSSTVSRWREGRLRNG